MIPVDMLCLHNPPESYGDCFRCCVASILELPAIEVPHFMEEDLRREQVGEVKEYRWAGALNAWLRPRGLLFLDLLVTPEMHGRWFEHLAPHGFSAYHILSGQSPRATHSVVALNGVMVHDPSPSRDGLIGPCEEGWFYGFFIRR